jgi:hypothetical protein
MKILMLSTDRALFDADSAVRLRLVEQAKLVSALHVVVLTPRGEKFKEFHDGHLAVYPTRSSGKCAYLPDAFREGRAIILSSGDAAEWLVTTQDPFELGAIGYILSRMMRIPLHLQIHTDHGAMHGRMSDM